MRKTGFAYLAYFLLANLGFLFFDAALDAWFYDTGSFFQSLFSLPEGHEAHLHSVVILLLAAMAFLGYRREVGQHRLERRLQASEAQFQTFAAAAVDAIVVIDHRGRAVFWNDAAVRMFGYTAAEILGQEIHSLLVPAQQRNASQQGIAAFAASGEGPVIGRTNSFIALTKDGSRLPVEHTIAAIEVDGQRYALGIIRDVSERQAALERLEASYTKVERARREWVNVFNAVRDPMFLHDGNGCLILANVAYLSWAELGMDEALGRPYWEVFPRREGPLPNCLHNMREGHDGARDEVGVDERIFISRAFSIQDEEGRYDCSIHILEDITDARRMERQIRERESRLSALFDAASNVALILVDGSSRIVEYNSGAQRILGYSREMMIGR